MTRRRPRLIQTLCWTVLFALTLHPGTGLPTRPVGVAPAWAEPQQAAPVRLILLGPPGAGKATQALRLADLYKVPAISTGQLLRQAAAVNTPEGLDLKKTLEKGDLVSDDTVINLLRTRLQQPDAAHGWVLHGYPRTLLQALALDHMLVEAKQAVQLVVSLDVPTPVLVERLKNRLACKICGRTYNSVTNPPQQAGVCDADGGELVLRPDDQPIIAQQRVEDQGRLHEEMKAYYGSRDIYMVIDGSGDIAGVQATINRELKKRTK
jgi:adenylate kinase